LAASFREYCTMRWSPTADSVSHSKGIERVSMGNASAVSGSALHAPNRQLIGKFRCDQKRVVNVCKTENKIS
jgi:hypothetical protein